MICWYHVSKHEQSPLKEHESGEDNIHDSSANPVKKCFVIFQNINHIQPNIQHCGHWWNVSTTSTSIHTLLSLQTTAGSCIIYIVLVSHPSQMCAVTMLVFWMPMNYDRRRGPPTACCAYQFSKQKSYYGQTHKKVGVHINAFLYTRSGLNSYLYTGNKHLE